MKTKLLRKKALPVLALALGAVVGLMFLRPAMAERAPQKFKVNEKGQTYGTMEGVGPDSPEVPDLVAAVGVGGVEGYISDADFNANQPKNPEEAIAYMERLHERIEEMKKTGEEYVRMIPLYDAEGNVIGEFGISPPW